MALCATTALAGAVSRLCVRGARGRFGGVRAGTWCCVSPSSPFPPRVSRVACGGPSLSGCPLSSLAGTPFHVVCAFRALGPVALLVVPACPFRVCALALSRCPLPAGWCGARCWFGLVRSAEHLLQEPQEVCALGVRPGHGLQCGGLGGVVGHRGLVEDVDAGVGFRRCRFLGTGSWGGGPCPALAPSGVEEVDDALSCGRLAVPLLGLG